MVELNVIGSALLLLQAGCLLGKLGCLKLQVLRMLFFALSGCLSFSFDARCSTKGMILTHSDIIAMPV